uniref:CatB-related O-acetyltransferase n=1 Tax=Pseudomonas laurentiana TaxID=2364649 RepID=UPI0029C8B8AA|nr:CatB-related O-acetyltransferase [Pseudomonas laurentiana]
MAYADFSLKVCLRRLLAPVLFARTHYKASLRKVKIEPGVICADFDRIGAYSFLGRNVTIGPNLERMGMFCSVGEGCLIGPNIHATDGLTTSVAFVGGIERKMIKQALNSRPVCMGNDVWVGSHAIIMSGVTVGDGVIIGAGSVLTKDAPPYSIWVGNPARLLKYRLSEATIERIQQLDIFSSPADTLYEWFKRSQGMTIKDALDRFQSS